MAESLPHIVIVGGGFAGLLAARRLKRAKARITLIDRRNHHVFQPLLYQVATAMLSPAQIASPIRHVLRRQKNTAVMLAEVQSIDAAGRSLKADGRDIAFDYLILATGASHSYFGNEQWAPFAPGLKSIEDALEIRRRFLLAFEVAENEPDAAERRRELTFVIVGGGPTGVELAGAMAEIARRAIPRDFRNIDTTTARIILVEAQDRVLAAFPARLSARARADLERLGVDVWLNTRVTAIDRRGVSLGADRLDAANIIWAAGVIASPLGGMLGAPIDRQGRVEVAPDLSVPGQPHVFVCGDLAHVPDARTGRDVPGVAPAAMQMGKFVARTLRAELAARAKGRPAPERRPFRYRNKGDVATIGRAKAVAHAFGMSWTGFFAWGLWASIHIFYLIGFRNRLVTMLDWSWNYLSFRRGVRLITGERPAKREA